MKDNLHVYIPKGDYYFELVDIISKLQDDIFVKCKDLNEGFNKKYNRFADNSTKLLKKVKETKKLKLIQTKLDALEEEFNNNETILEYRNFINDRANDSKPVDKDLLEKYNAIKDDNNKTHDELSNAYNTSPIYVKYKAKIDNMKIDLLKSKEVNDLNRCVFKNFKKEYASNIKLLLKYIKDDPSNLKVYNYLNKINLEKMTFAQYLKVTLIFNQFSQQRFLYVQLPLSYGPYVQLKINI